MTLPFPFGVQLTALSVTPPNRSEFLDSSGSNRILNARYINPLTLDFELSPNGQYAGMDAVDQQVQLALTTTLGSAAQSNLGSALRNVKVITPTVQNDVQTVISQALLPLVNAGSISVQSVTVSIPFTNQISVSIDFTNLTTGQNVTMNLPLTPGIY